jgi:uncharacterized protein
MTQRTGTALITGASSGIGAVYADRLARQGMDLILVARNLDRLEALAHRIEQQTGRLPELVGADLTEPADIARVERVLRADGGITMLINNAGVGSTAALLSASVEKMERIVTLNVTALMRLTYAAVPGFVARGVGSVINIASIVAVAPELLNGVYGGTKAFVLAFSQSLHHELAGRGVRVQVVLPGAVETPFWQASGTPLHEFSPERRRQVMSPDDLVDAALAGFDQGEFATLPSLPDGEQWVTLEAARHAMGMNLRSAEVADRYRVPAESEAHGVDKTQSDRGRLRT